MFLSLKQNLKEKLCRFTKNTSSILKLQPTSHSFNFTEKASTFDRIENKESDIIDKYFSEHEQYIANFYKKHKENFLFQETHDQEFEEFLIQMDKLMSNDSNRRRLVSKYIGDMHKISFQSREPLREVLIYYQMFLTNNGYNADALAETLLYIGKVYQSRENFHRVYSDYTHWDFINSYRMYHIIEDLKYGLSFENSFFNADHMAKAVRGLILSGYKSSQVADLVFERIISNLTKTKMDKKYEKFVDNPSAGKYNFYPTNNRAEDLFYEEKYRKHLYKLSQFNFGEEEEEETNSINTNNTNNSNNSNNTNNTINKSNTINISNTYDAKVNDTKKVNYDEEIMTPIKEIIELLKETKEIQHNLTDSIDNLLEQYYSIEQALITNPELKANPYIKYELFKLQDKLVEGGYLSIEALNEVTKQKLSKENLEKLKEENVKTVLKNFVLVNFPNLYNAGENKLDGLLSNDEENKFENFELNSSRFKMTDLALGKNLAALSDYAKITNVDINGEDYCNDKIVSEFVDEGFMKGIKDQIKIKACYSKLFHKTENFLKKIQPSISNSKINECQDISALGYIYYAYSNMNISCKELKSQIVNRMNILVNENIVLDNEGIKYIITGLAKGEIRNETVNQIVKKVSQKIKVDDVRKLEDLIGLMWGLSAFKLASNDVFIQLMIKLSENSDNLINYVTNQREFDIYLYQLSVCLKYECKDEITIPNNLSFLLDLHLNLRDYTYEKLSTGNSYKQLQSIPNEALVDPLKKVLVNAMQEGIFNKDMTKRQNNAITNLETMDAPGTLPFYPDLVFGFYGHKVALFVLGKDYITDETDINNSPVNGYCAIIKRVLLEKFNTHAVFIPTNQLIKFNLETVQMDLVYSSSGTQNKGTEFTHMIENIIAKGLGINLEFNNVFQINKYLNTFIKKFANSEVGDLIINTESNLENYMNTLLKIIDLHSELVHSYHPSLLKKKVEELVLSLEKNAEYFKTTTDGFKLFINQIVKEITNAEIDYQIFVDNLIKNYQSFITKVSKSKAEEMNEDLVITTGWIGKRLNVDVIPDANAHIKDKNISVELLNNNYMWLGEYNPYEDWEKELKGLFDNFNYFVENSNNKFLFNSHKLGNRNVAKGVFPHPNKFREIKKPLITKSIESESDYEYELKTYQNYNEKLIIDEVDKNSKFIKNEIDAEKSLKVNLLNIKNSIKQNFTDNQIIKFITNFEFIDNLINEHLEVNKENSNSTNAKLLSRDPEAFRNFYKKLSNVTGQYDEYDKFVMREYYNQEKIFEIDSTVTHEENLKRIEDRMTKKVEENEDNDTLSVYNPNIIDYKFDIKTILSSIKLMQNDSEYDLECYSKNPEDFITRKRLVAERNLILLKITVKLLDAKILNENEIKYLQHLVEKAQTVNLNKLEDIGVNNSHTKLTFQNLSANDAYALNTLYNVDINSNAFTFSLSELILELSHFIDNSTINKITSHLFENLVLKGQKQNKFNLFPIENKEPGLISNEINESLWRISGFINEEDKAKLKGMLQVKRGKSKFDKFWLQIDEKSLEDFLKTSNLQEDRLKYLEKWIKRKEKEIENRIDLPPDNLTISDTKINHLIEKKDKSFRKTLLSNMFKVDDLNKIDSRSLQDFITEFTSSLYLFNFNYPQTIKDIFNALEDVPSIFEEDRQLLKSYRMFFTIDEQNPFEYLSVAPVKMESEKMFAKSTSNNTVDSLIDEGLKKRVKSASIPFVKNVVERIEMIIRNIKH